MLLPSLVTVLGLGCGLAGLALVPCTTTPIGPALLLGSLVLDLVDGFLARRLRAETIAGAELDWHADVALAHLAAWGFLGDWAVLGLVLWQASARARAWRSSGRAAVFLVVIAKQWCW